MPRKIWKSRHDAGKENEIQERCWRTRNKKKGSNSGTMPDFLKQKGSNLSTLSENSKQKEGIESGHNAEEPETK